MKGLFSLRGRAVDLVKCSSDSGCVGVVACCRRCDSSSSLALLRIVCIISFAGSRIRSAHGHCCFRLLWLMLRRCCWFIVFIVENDARRVVRVWWTAGLTWRIWRAYGWCVYSGARLRRRWLLLVFAHVFVDEWLISLWCPFGVASSITIGVNQLDSWVQELVLCEGDIHREDYFVLIQVVYFVTLSSLVVADEDAFVGALLRLAFGVDASITDASKYLQVGDFGYISPCAVAKEGRRVNCFGTPSCRNVGVYHHGPRHFDQGPIHSFRCAVLPLSVGRATFVVDPALLQEGLQFAAHELTPVV
ncbi:hypothetical protein LEN26_012889 [Aphanomyces euteiches]|nr:hypothetical protein AeMF1_014165 [Aphanomyces euteiches]KAH9116421.1 hypothetical protein LEN26_012889 [Aphanomyces euteiches]